MHGEKCPCGKKSEMYGRCWKCLERDEQRRDGHLPPENDTPCLGQNPMDIHK